MNAESNVLLSIAVSLAESGGELLPTSLLKRLADPPFGDGLLSRRGRYMSGPLAPLAGPLGTSDALGLRAA